MNKKFTINGKEVIARDFDFNMMADFDEMGVDVQKILTSPLVAGRAYVALCMGIDKEDAGNEIQAHIMAGGNLDEVVTVLAEKVVESDFFLKAVEQTQKTTTQKKSAKK